ncbi:MAG: PAS domain S-box protein, partial [Ignavibacteria bacterium]|nr:PAS domain S-box protein [Ignavibacteria bacterium]
MKKILIDFIENYFEEITKEWFLSIRSKFESTFLDSDIIASLRTSLHIILSFLKNEEDKNIEERVRSSFQIYQLANISLLDLSQILFQGRYTITKLFDERYAEKYDLILFHEYIESCFERLYVYFLEIHKQIEINRVEKMKEELQAKLDRSEYYLKNILAGSHDAIMEISTDEKIISWSAGAEKIFGYTHEEIINQQSTFLMPSTFDKQKEINWILNEVKTKGYIRDFETVRVSKSGAFIPVILTVTPLYDRTGKLIGRTVILKDIRELKKLQRQVDQSERLAVIGQLAAGVAHEIGNPLASISSIVQLLQRKTRDNFQLEQLSNIKSSIDRISKIVHELVDFSRPPSQEYCDVNINEILETAIGIVKYDKRLKDIQFITTYHPELPNLWLVPDQIFQVIINILLNAVDAMDGTGTIKISTGIEDSKVYINLQDSGHGIPENIINKIFDPFFT